MIVVLEKHVSSAEWQGTRNILTKKNRYSILESDTGERHAAWTPYRQKGAGTDESKKNHTCSRSLGHMAGASDGLHSVTAAGSGMRGGAMVVCPAGRAI